MAAERRKGQKVYEEDRIIANRTAAAGGLRAAGSGINCICGTRGGAAGVGHNGAAGIGRIGSRVQRTGNAGEFGGGNTGADTDTDTDTNTNTNTDPAAGFPD